MKGIGENLRYTAYDFELFTVTSNALMATVFVVIAIVVVESNVSDASLSRSIYVAHQSLLFCVDSSPPK